MNSLRLPAWNTMVRWHERPGTGEAIVCLPGLSFAAVPSFLPLLMQPGLRNRRALMIDYVGSGFSGHSERFGYSLAEHAQAMAAVLDTAGTGPASILGHSMGGSVGIALALARPDLVARLIVCEGNLTSGGGVATRKIAAFNVEDYVGHEYARAAAQRAAAAMTGDKLADFICAARTGADPRGVHGNSVALVTLADDFQQRFLALAAERHFVWGELTYPGNTGEVTPDAPDPVLLQAHGVGVHVVPGVGHSLMVEDPVAFAAVVETLV